MKKKKIGFTAGNFDLLHPGYIYTFEEARKHCDHFIVFLHSNPSEERNAKYKPVVPLYERYKVLKALEAVDEVYTYNTEEDLVKLILFTKPDIRILGEEYKDKDFTGKDICARLGIDLYFNKRDHRFSTSDLRKRICQ